MKKSADILNTGKKSMKKNIKLGIYFVVATLIFYFILKIFFSLKMSAPVPDVMMEDKTGQIAIIPEKAFDWVNWVIASSLSLISYAGKKGVDLLFTIFEIKIKRGKNDI
jgi:hypothetical protein